MDIGVINYCMTRQLEIEKLNDLKFQAFIMDSVRSGNAPFHSKNGNDIFNNNKNDLKNKYNEIYYKEEKKIVTIWDRIDKRKAKRIN